MPARPSATSVGEGDEGLQFHDFPELYLELMRAEVPAYDQFQDGVADACRGGAVERMLELGVGTGETARRVMAVQPGAVLVAIDESADMVSIAGAALPAAEVRVGRLEDPLPAGPFGLVYGAFVVHHLGGAGKAELFERVAAVLGPRGRLVIGDVVVPDDPADAITPLDAERDRPDRLDDQLGWLAAAGFEARVAWQHHDLVVIVAAVP